MALLNKGNEVGVIVMDLSKGFDKLCKLKAYGFDANTRTFIQSYFSNRHQRTKVGGKFREYQKVS